MIRFAFYSALCILMLPLIGLNDLMAVSRGSSPLYTHFVYMFSHASLIHWLVNSWSVLILHNCMHWYRLLVSYLFAVAVSFFLPTPMPVLGLSAITTYFIGYLLIHLYRRERLTFWLTIALVIIGLALPNIAGSYHLVMMLLGVVSYLTERTLRSIISFIR